MPGRKNNQMKILIRDKKIITRKKLFEEKEKFHREQAKLPFEKKISMLIHLQEIAQSIYKSSSSRKLGVWGIYPKSKRR